MADTVENLHLRMEEAAKALDFEEASRLRDQINLIRGGASADDAAHSDLSGLIRQQPGAMGLGTNHRRLAPPPDWKPPSKPDPMTRVSSRKRTKGA
ncbi:MULTISPECIES: UvrB/UvrC motif-containing protein [unclassified Novosphingobium]|uniref:UvrB/UvrC motif-containing protein n=1 Tax=unclassified Novosphingobium TaxID=2644732 RepID=UPI00135C4B19|nr:MULTISPECIES: UvrB/UvrC motif-containing protein [unclassified Novosphingobium]